MAEQPVGCTVQAAAACLGISHIVRQVSAIAVSTVIHTGCNVTAHNVAASGPADTAGAYGSCLLKVQLSFDQHMALQGAKTSGETDEGCL